MSLCVFERRGLLAFALSLACLAVLAIGCSSNKESTTSPAVQPSVNDDVAASVASSMGADDGGAMDQAGDAMAMAGPVGPSGLQALSDATSPVTATYDDQTGIWTIEISRVRGSETGLYYAYIQRTYQLQLLNKNDVPQKFWVVGSDTACTAHFDIVSGAGRHRTPGISQELTGLSGTWTVTGVDTDTLTINGTYMRSARDTVRSLYAVRVLNDTLNLNFINVKGPRGTRLNFIREASGTITGTYTADITFLTGTGYKERRVERTFTITLANGNAIININGLHFACDIGTGMLKD